MKKEFVKTLSMALAALVLFAIWTMLVCFLDVQVIGPRESAVGFATVNQFIHRLTGVHMTMYHITDWLGLVPVAFGFGFAILGLVQWIQRSHITRVDGSLLILGGFYMVVLAAYLFFEDFVVNYRPILIGGYLEASYPSSTTMLVLCVIPTAMMQLGTRIQNSNLKRCILGIMGAFVVFMVVGRLISGVHWLSDIIGGILLSYGLVMLYHAFSKLTDA